MKQIIIALGLFLIGILILVVSNHGLLLTLSSVLFLGATGFLIHQPY